MWLDVIHLDKFWGFSRILHVSLLFTAALGHFVPEYHSSHFIFPAALSMGF
jgi:hypothetical protein